MKAEIGPLMKRRMKEDYLEGLPEKKELIYRVEMPQEQLDRYLDIIRRAREKLPDPLSGRRKQHIFATIGALRDVSLHPYLLSFSEQGLAELSPDEIIKASARLQKTMEILEEVCKKREKAIVFVISRKMQRVLQRLIQDRFGINCLRPINGEVSGGRRKDLVDTFQRSKGFNVIIMSTEAAGVGLNVTAANHVIHLSRPWNPAKEDQATDRVYRIGQNLPVSVHILLAVHPMFDNAKFGGTFDLKLHRLLEEKRQLSRSVLLPATVEEKEWLVFGEDILQAPIELPDTKKPLTMSDIDRMPYDLFEKAVAKVYERMGYEVELTPRSRDYGADIIAEAKSDYKPSLVIQCKHTSDPARSAGQDGIKEVLAAAGVYGERLGTKLSKLVVTNAITFTGQAREVAAANAVGLVDRENLANLLQKYNVYWQDVL